MPPETITKHSTFKSCILRLSPNTSITITYTYKRSVHSLIPIMILPIYGIITKQFIMTLTKHVYDYSTEHCIMTPITYD